MFYTIFIILRGVGIMYIIFEDYPVDSDDYTYDEEIINVN